MIKKLWRQYLYVIIIYSDAKGELKHLIANLMSIVLFVPINYFIFGFVFGSGQYLYIFFLTIGYSRLFLACIMEKYKRNFGKGYTFFLRLVSYSTIMFVTFGGTFMLIKDAQENQSVTSKLLLNEVTTRTKNMELNSSNQKSNLILLPNKDVGMWK
jgi:hypothetical protein